MDTISSPTPAAGREPTHKHIVGRDPSEDPHPGESPGGFPNGDLGGRGSGRDILIVDDNPDRANRSPVAIPCTAGSWTWPAAWTPVFALNLIVPLEFAAGVIDGRSKAGMYCGIALYWAFGLTACATRPTLGRMLVIGGLIVAVSQFTPLVQFVAGSVAVMIRRQFVAESSGLCGFIDVMITGGLLLFVAYFAGRLWVSLERLGTESSRPPVSASGQL